MIFMRRLAIGCNPEEHKKYTGKEIVLYCTANMPEDFNTTTYSLVAVFLGLCTYIIWFYKKAFNYWKEQGLDYLDPTIPFGNAAKVYLKQCTLGELFAQFYLQLKERGVKHGGAYFFWRPVYMPIDPDIIKRILISDFENFPNHGLYISKQNDPLSTHLFDMEGARWKTLRFKMPANFTSAKMRKMFIMMEKMNEQFIKNLDLYADTGTAVDIKKETAKLNTDTVCACIFGIESRTMNEENKEMLKQGRSFFDYQWGIYKNTAVIMVPRYILEKLNFRIITKEVENYFINLCKKIVNYRKDNHIQKGDTTDTLMRLMEKNEKERDFTGKAIMEPLDFSEFTAQMCLFFAAGFETSSSTQSFATYELAKHPECQKTLREEIERVLTKHDNKLTYDAVMEMKFLDNIVDETLRLYPVIPILPRICIKDYKVSGTDVTIEKNTFVMVSNMGIQRDPKYYPEPEKFIPERFSNENKSGRPLVTHLPFGEGPRMCIGKRFGLLQTKLGLITIVRNYEISLNESKTTPSLKFEPNELILRKTGDIWINLKKIINN